MKERVYKDKALVVLAIVGLFVAVALTFTGCSGGGDNPAGPNEKDIEYRNLIVGSWRDSRYTDSITTYGSDGSYQRNASSCCFAGTGTYRIENGYLEVWQTPEKSDGTKLQPTYRRSKIIELTRERLILDTNGIRSTKYRV